MIHAISLPRPRLSMFAIYESPRDFPGEFVARRFDVLAGVATPIAGPVVARGPTLEKCRGRLPPCLTRLERDPRDEPQIVEVWL